MVEELPAAVEVVELISLYHDSAGVKSTAETFLFVQTGYHKET